MNLPIDKTRLKDTFARGVTALHTQVYRRTGGKVGAKIGPTNMGLLTHTGRKSGQPRTTPLNCTPDGDQWDGNVGARLLYKMIGWALRSRTR